MRGRLTSRLTIRVWTPPSSSPLTASPFSSDDQAGRTRLQSCLRPQKRSHGGSGPRWNVARGSQSVPAAAQGHECYRLVLAPVGPALPSRRSLSWQSSVGAERRVSTRDVHAPYVGAYGSLREDRTTAVACAATAATQVSAVRQFVSADTRAPISDSLASAVQRLGFARQLRRVLQLNSGSVGQAARPLKPAVRM
jgi:hypothetical protein